MDGFSDKITEETQAPTSCIFSQVVYLGKPGQLVFCSESASCELSRLSNMDNFTEQTYRVWNDVEDMCNVIQKNFL